MTADQTGFMLATAPQFLVAGFQPLVTAGGKALTRIWKLEGE